MSLSLLISIFGLLLWLVFTKWQKIADTWVARVGEWMFVVGLFCYLFFTGGKTLFEVLAGR